MKDEFDFPLGGGVEGVGGGGGDGVGGGEEVEPVGEGRRVVLFEGDILKHNIRMD